MANDYNKPPTPLLVPDSTADVIPTSQGASVQLLTLIKFMIEEFIDDPATGYKLNVDSLIEEYKGYERDLYDMVINSINNQPQRLKKKHGYTTMQSIFDEYSGLTAADRKFTPPIGTKIFKTIGVIDETGFRPVPELTPRGSLKAEMQQRLAQAPTGAESTRSAMETNAPRGFVSPSTPEQGRFPWPARRQLNREDRDGSITAPRSKVIANASVRAPSKDIRDYGRREPRREPDSPPAVPDDIRQTPRLREYSINFNAPEVVLRPLSEAVQSFVTTESGAIEHWTVADINAASRELTRYLRHGAKNPNMNYVLPNGYLSVAIILQLPVFAAKNITKEVIEMVVRLKKPRIMMNERRTQIRAIEGHTLDIFDPELLYEPLASADDFRTNPIWNELEDNTGAPDYLILEISQESVLDQWARTGTLVAGSDRRFLVLKPHKGLGEVDTGDRPTILCAYISLAHKSIRP